MKTKNKYLKFLLGVLLCLPNFVQRGVDAFVQYVLRTQQLLKVPPHTIFLWVRLIYFSNQQQYQKLKYRRFIKGLFCATLVICLSFGQLVSAQTPNANSLVEQGIEDYKNGNFQDAVENWKQALIHYKNNPSARAVVHENLGRAYQKLGKNKDTIKSLSEAIRDYEIAEDMQQVGRTQTELAQFYSNLGQPRKAIALLCGKLAEKKSETSTNKGKNSEEIKCTPESAEQIATKYDDTDGKVAALGVLGEAYRLIGNYDQAIEYLEEANKLAPDDFLVLNSLGNTYRSRAQLQELQAKSAEKLRLLDKEKDLLCKFINDYKQAYQYFQDSIKFAREKEESLAEIRGLLNLIRLDSQTNLMKAMDDVIFKDTVDNARKIIDKLPDSTTKVYGMIDLAYLQRHSQGTSPFINCPTKLFLSKNEVLSLLQKSVQTSNNLKNNRLQSYANGALGHLWECRQDSQKALKYTQNAILAADQNLGAKDSLYLWEWQAGRILEKQQRTEEAIASYQRAFDILEDIRQDILTSERDVQFDFRDVVRPLYRKLAESRLEPLQDPAIANKERQEELSKVVTTIDALKLAELQDYFGNDCILNALNPKLVGEILEDKDNRAKFKNTAFFSSIILDGKTGILLQLPGPETKFKFKWIKDPNQEGTDKIVSTDTLREKIDKFRQGLREGNLVFEYDTKIAAQLYDWIIRPFVKDGDISPQKIKTLVFLQNGFLRSVPMAALYDRESNKYLVETYAIATTTSLRLTTPKPRRNKQKALILGLKKEAVIDGIPFISLPAVKTEVDAVKKQFPNHTELIDDNFTPDNFKQKLKETTYSIVHIASHAQFGIIPEDTFIVTGKNQKITISELEESLQNLKSRTDSVELLTLTACETALGDDRATLGLAGVALKLGVQSAIASLWSVQDASTSKLVEEFYENYRKGKMSIAEALQKAQIKMISKEIDVKYDNPAYWAPMIVIGNWL